MARRRRRERSVENPAADRGLNPLTTGAATGYGPDWVRTGRDEGVDTPLPYNPVSNSVAFQDFLARPEEFRQAPQAGPPRYEGTGVYGGPPGPVAREGEARHRARLEAARRGTEGDRGSDTAPDR